MKDDDYTKYFSKLLEEAKDQFQDNEFDLLKYYLGLAIGIGYDLHTISKARAVVQLDTHGNIIEYYKSASEAAALSNVDVSAIYKVCNGINHSAKKKLFKYYDETNEYKQKNIHKTKDDY